MPTQTRSMLTEFVWLIASAALTAILVFLCFGLVSINATVDIHLYDTYFVIAPWWLQTPVFLLITFIIYFIKEFRKSFTRRLPNWILLIAGLGLVIALTFLINTFSQFSFGGSTLYPPLSNLGADQEAELTQDPVSKFLTNLFIALQVVTLIMLIFAAYRWGKSKKKS